jgi:MFS family permease
LFQFLFTPVLGALSDRFGRRPVLLLCLLGASVSYLLFGIADRFIFLGVEVVLAVLFIARIFAGVTGGSIATAQAYIADVTTPEDRAKGLGLIGAAFGLGFMLGPALGGLLSTFSLEAPAFLAAALTLSNVIFGYFRLPESLPWERRSRELSIAKLNPFARLGHVLAKDAIRPLLIGVLLLNFAFAGLQNNFAVYTDERFGWGPMENAFVFAFIGLVAVIIQGFLLRKLVPAFGEARLAVSGLVFMIIGFALTAFVPQAGLLYVAMGVMAAGSGMATPSLTSLISRQVSPQEQGSVLGGVQAFNSLMMVLGPLFAGYVFDAIGITAPYIAGVVLAGAAALIIGVALRDAFSRAVPEQPAQLEQGAVLDSVTS